MLVVLVPKLQFGNTYPQSSALLAVMMWNSYQHGRRNFIISDDLKLEASEDRGTQAGSSGHQEIHKYISGTSISCYFILSPSHIRPALRCEHVTRNDLHTTESIHSRLQFFCSCNADTLILIKIRWCSTNFTFLFPGSQGKNGDGPTFPGSPTSTLRVTGCHSNY